MNINYQEYLDKVRGCWAGKNIGGTLGAPMEGDMHLHDVSFYTQELNGVPAPNDDLDLQLIWLAAVETRGLDNITPNLLGEYWDQCIIAPCSEYSICKMNIANGFLPPLSGAVNNDRFRYSNGAWIRSEIWACLCPGAPDQAIRYAYMDSSADHSEEGIWAEMFTAALESAAFAVQDIRTLIEIALSKVPVNSQLAAAVTRTIECYDSKMSWQDARAVLVKEFDIRNYRAAVNIGFVIIGLLYGEGDFDRSICTAVNCGDDSDCTGATVGSIFGILKGRSGIPARWLEPIGESISTICINHFAFYFLYGLPKTLEALSQRTVQAALASANPLVAHIVNGETEIPREEIAKMSGGEAAKRLLELPLYYQDFALPWVTLRAEYPTGPVVTPGDQVRLICHFTDSVHVNAVFTLRLRNLPEGWSAPIEALSCCLRSDSQAAVTFDLTVGAMPDTMQDIEIEVEMQGRRVKQPVRIPFQRAGAVCYTMGQESEQSFRCRTRIEAGAQDAERLAVITPQM